MKLDKKEIESKKGTITISDLDRDIFLKALENPPKPNKHLRNAFKKYKEKAASLKNETGFNFIQTDSSHL